MNLLAHLITILALLLPALATAEEVSCLPNEVQVHLGIELQADFWYYIPHPDYTPRSFCVKPFEAQSYVLSQPQPRGDYYSKIHFTLSPLADAGSYVVDAFREDSYDNVNYKFTERHLMPLSNNASAMMELGGWYYFQRQNFRVTFSY